MYLVGIITASDKASIGQRIDSSGPLIKTIIEPKGYEVIKYVIVPDDHQVLVDTMKEMVDTLKVNLILTTGGTGFSPRDHTPEATLAVIDRQVPGIPEAMRQYSLQITPKAMLSRAVAGIRKNTLIINLPGSPKAVKENLESIIDAVSHGLDILLEYDAECGAEVNA